MRFTKEAQFFPGQSGGLTFARIQDVLRAISPELVDRLKKRYFDEIFSRTQQSKETKIVRFVAACRRRRRQRRQRRRRRRFLLQSK